MKKSINTNAIEDARETDDISLKNREIPVQGRGAFLSEINASGVVVSTVFLADDGRVFSSPAVFPNVQYAIEQIDDLKRLVIKQFDQAAQVGAQVIAAEVRV